MKRTLLATAVLCLLTHVAWAADWPQYRADAARSGYTSERLAADLSPRWIYKSRHNPRPAWLGDDTRMPFDYAYHTVVADGLLFFGSSADCKVYALDAATGEERWAFFTDAPVRFAPAVWKDRLFVVSDDGCLYCLSAKRGALLWKKRGGPDDSMLLGNDRMVSRWPARGGPAIVDGVVYFGAGIWPSEGIYLYAIDAASGKTLWVNDSSGAIEMDQPHETARAKSGVSAQGYLIASGDRMLVPTGRAVPAAFDRTRGDFLYFHLQANRAGSSSSVTAIDRHFVSDGVVFDAETGEREASLRCSALAATPGKVFYAVGQEISCANRKRLIIEKDTVDRKGKPVKKKVLNNPLWSMSTTHPGIISLIVASDSIVFGTLEKKVVVADATSRKVLWSTEVDGCPWGLAVAAGRLYVSTDQGTIYCFDDGGKRSPNTIEPKRAGSPYTSDGEYAKAAEEIIKAGGMTGGYCLDLGCGDGELAYELARRTNLQIYAVESDPDKVLVARKKLDDAGLYGVRVTVHQRELENPAYPPYFANLIVSGRSVEQGRDGVPVDQAYLMQRPYGGVAVFGKTDAMRTSVRGKLQGAGTWTHQYCDPANTCCSTDTLVKAPLSMLWFRDSDFLMPSRHGRGPAPLFADGRLFVEGMHGLRAVDAYNGRTLWEFPIEDILTPYDQEHLVGTASTNSNFCMEGGTIYLRTGGRCLCIDAATGRQVAEFPTPLPAGQPGTWGYIACENGTLFGTVANTEHVVYWTFGKSDMTKLFGESSAFFALDAETGKLKWSYTARNSIRHNAIAVGDGRVFLIDRPLDVADTFEYQQAKRRRKPLPETATSSAKDAKPLLVCLDANSGKLLWKTDDDVYGTVLALSLKHDILLMTQQHTRFKLPSERGGRMTAFRASDGTRVWETQTVRQEKSSRPIINDDVIYNEPGAWSLLTGEKLDFNLERSYGCGILSGSPNLLVYRSATIGYRDLEHGTETENYGGIRPACWINALPVGGLVLLPDATSRCTCSYLIKASIALQPKGEL
jgi:outer membrane protein assembly factor BamB